MRLFVLIVISSGVIGQLQNQFMPTKCEICALTAIEFNELSEKIHKRLPSEFADLTENICLRFNEFKIHKEKEGLQRFSRQQSQTMETLRKMKMEGVQVDLGMPYEMWDAPAAEVTAIRQGCEGLIEEYEDILEDWFLHKESLNVLLIRMCKQEALRKESSYCLPLKSSSKEEL